jgi:DNA invertase Pin-like site-specific DNA recombinase
LLREIDMVAAWSVDRLERSPTDLLELLRELHSNRGEPHRFVVNGIDGRAARLARW